MRRVGSVRVVGPAEERVLRQFAVFVGAGYLVYVVLSVDAIARNTTFMAPWWTWSTPIVVSGSGVAVAVMGRLGSLRGIRIIALVAATTYLLALILAFIAVQGRSMSSHGLWIDTFPALGAIALTTISLRLAVGYMGVLAILLASSRLVVVSAQWREPFVAEVVWSWSFSLIFIVSTAVGQRTARALDETREQAYAVAARSASERARQIERGRFDALTHDGVMAVLQSAYRQGNSATVAQLASRTLDGLRMIENDDLDEEDMPVTRAVTHLRGAISTVDDAARLEVTGDALPMHSTTYPSEAVRTITSATIEAVRNVERHAHSARPPSVSVRCDVDRITVTVRDWGVGFTMAEVPPHRMGIAVSILGRIDLLPGGWADIRSAPGDGTTVTMGWHRP